MKKIVQILGPTGTGKTGITLELCKRTGGEVISADSVQVYKGFDIGTDKILPEEMDGIPHHLIDIFEPPQQFNASVFMNLSYQTASKLVERKILPFVCGGTALYQRVMIKGLFEDKGEKRVTRKKLSEIADSLGVERLWQRVNELDPVYAETISSGDRKRIIRALEIFYNNKIIPSKVSEKNYTPFKNWNFLRIGIMRQREELYRRIEIRVDRMVERGLLTEVEKLLHKYPPSAAPFQSIGYREMVQHINGEISMDEAVKLIKQHTRNFAKRQLSWYRQEQDILWFTPDEREKIMDKVAGFLDK